MINNPVYLNTNSAGMQPYLTQGRLELTGWNLASRDSEPWLQWSRAQPLQGPVI